MNIGLEVFLIILSISTAIATLLAFVISRRKDHHATGKFMGILESKVEHVEMLYVKIEKYYDTLMPIMQGAAATEALLKAVEKQLDTQNKQIDKMQARIDELYFK